MGHEAKDALLFYTKPDCPLCDKAWPVAERVAERTRREIRRVDISGDPSLMAEHGERIPVLELGGETLGWGRLSERAIDRRLRELGIAGV